MLIYRDYEMMVPKLNQSVRYEQTPEKITHQDRILVLEEFNRLLAPYMAHLFQIPLNPPQSPSIPL